MIRFIRRSMDWWFDWICIRFSTFDSTSTCRFYTYLRARTSSHSRVELEYIHVSNAQVPIRTCVSVHPSSKDDCRCRRWCGWRRAWLRTPHTHHVLRVLTHLISLVCILSFCTSAAFTDLCLQLHLCMHFPLHIPTYIHTEHRSLFKRLLYHGTVRIKPKNLLQPSMLYLEQRSYYV